MKKFFYLFLISGFMLSSCELEDENNPNGGGNDGGGNNNQAEGTVQSFSVPLSYNSMSLSSKASFDMHNCVAVAPTDSDADVTLCYQDKYKYAMVTPNSSWLKDLYRYNIDGDGDGLTIINSNSTTIGKVSGSLSNYDDIDELKALNVTSGSIEKLGQNQVQVSNGDIIAFQTGNVKGVGQITGLPVVSKVTATATFKGYVYYPSSSAK